jgi:hypothetical protein
VSHDSDPSSAERWCPTTARTLFSRRVQRWRRSSSVLLPWLLSSTHVVPTSFSFLFASGEMSLGNSQPGEAQLAIHILQPAGGNPACDSIIRPNRPVWCSCRSLVFNNPYQDAADSEHKSPSLETAMAVLMAVPLLFWGCEPSAKLGLVMASDGTIVF